MLAQPLPRCGSAQCRPFTATPSQRAHKLQWRGPATVSSTAVRASASPDAAGQKGLASGVQRVARKIQAALPIVGLLSRLTATTGGVGSDVLSYPEYCRKMIDAAPPGFDQAVAEWEQMFGKVRPPTCEHNIRQHGACGIRSCL